MANNWGISKEVELLVEARDTKCVYCQSDFSIEHQSLKTIPTWEHIINDLEMRSAENIALCCFSCNSSKGAKRITDWFTASYCKNKGITAETVAQVVKAVIEREERARSSNH